MKMRSFASFSRALIRNEGFSESALAAYAEAVSAKHPSTKNLYFDVAEVSLVLRGQKENLRKVVTFMRQIGLGRILYGSDGPEFGDSPSRERWTAFRRSMPLREDDFNKIAGNVAPYIR